jgi:hypothetical protein
MGLFNLPADSLQLLQKWRSVPSDDPHGMDYAGNVAEDRQQDIDPEVLGKPYLQEHTQWWEKYGDYDA